MVEPIQHIDFSAPDEGCDGPYGAVALNLWDQGYATLPVAPLTKKPAVKDWAQRRADDITLAEIVAETVEFSRHNVGVVLGESIVAIDVDSDDPTHLEPVTALCERLGFWKCARRGAKGFALFLRVDEPFKFDGHAEWVQAKFYNHKDPERRSAVVELYTRGRQMVVPPSIHPDTRAPYVWLTQHGLENIPADELPLASARTMMQLAEGLEELGMKVGQPRLRKAAGATSGAAPAPLTSEQAKAEAETNAQRRAFYELRGEPRVDQYALMASAIPHWLDIIETQAIPYLRDKCGWPLAAPDYLAPGAPGNRSDVWKFLATWRHSTQSADSVQKGKARSRALTIKTWAPESDPEAKRCGPKDHATGETFTAYQFCVRLMTPVSWDMSWIGREENTPIRAWILKILKESSPEFAVAHQEWEDSRGAFELTINPKRGGPTQ